MSIPVRLGDLTGVAGIGGGAAAALIATAVLAVFVIAAFVLPRRRPSRLEWFAIVATVLVGIAQLGPAWYYEHYAAFIAPFLGILLGISLARLCEPRATRVAVAIATVVVAVLLVSQVVLVHGESVPDIANIVDAIVPAGGCTLSDAPSKLVTTNRFVATAPGCTDMVDSQGATLSYGYGSAGAQHLWTIAVEHADYLVTSTPFAGWYIPPDRNVARVRGGELPAPQSWRAALLRAQRVPERLGRRWREVACLGPPCAVPPAQRSDARLGIPARRWRRDPA